MQANPESGDEVEMDSMWTRHGVHQGDSILNDKWVRVLLAHASLCRESKAVQLD